ncbi:MAG: hypothetical protein AABX65_00420 [Nanoarchaeota archaeon]
MAEEKSLKMAVLAGATLAIKYKEKKPSASETEIIRSINNELDKIVEKIDI